MTDSQEKSFTLRDAAVLAVIALVIRLIHLDHTPQVDELNHVLAARSLLTDGTLSIDGGAPYTRASLFTYLVAGLFALFGESLVVARLPSVVAGTALVVLTFVWVRRVAGGPSAWIAGLLICFDPNALYHSQQARFYSIQSVLFIAGAVIAYELLTASGDRKRALTLGAGAVAAFLLATHLQIITVVGIMGVALGLVLARTPDWLGQDRGSRPVIVGGLVLAGAVVLIVASVRLMPSAWELFRYADLWAQADSSNYRYYHWMLLRQYTTFWSVFPIVLLLAAKHNLRATLFSIGIFGFVLAFHSLAAWKHPRYVLYAMPMFAALVGIATATVLPSIARSAKTVMHSLVGGSRSAGWTRGLATVALIFAALFFIGSNLAFSTTFKMLVFDDDHWTGSDRFRGEPNWQTAAVALGDIVDSSHVVLSSSPLKAVYYLNRLEIILSANQLVTRAGNQPEFFAPPKLGRPAISTPASLDEIMDCHRTGIVFIEEAHWRSPSGVPPSTVDRLVSRAERVLAFDTARLHVFRWRTPEAEMSPSCRPA